MSVKNRAKRLASLGRDRLVDLDGKLVKRIAEHPAFASPPRRWPSQRLEAS